MSREAMFVQFGVPLVGGLVGLLLVWAAVRAGRRQRLIDNLPTCKTTGVFIGLVELKGTAEASEPLMSYLAEAPCVHYRWGIDEHWSRTVVETYTDSQGKTRTRIRHESGWKTVASGGEQIRFYLKDDCGVIRIDPERASIEAREVFDVTCGRSHALYYGKGPAGAVSHSDHRRRFREEAIPLHAPLYAMGMARERDDVVAPEISYDRDAPLFLISTRTEAQVRAGVRAQFWGLGGLGLVPMVGGCVLRDHLLGLDPAPRIRWYSAIGAAYLAAWLLGWLWMAYNSMVDLHQRVQQAWANVDVQLRRRHDLIPNLVRVVEGLREHERHVQVELARLRQQLAATPPGKPGPDPAGLAGCLRVVLERYPELRANDAFMNLHQNLVDTEQRIALARSYFNDIATFYNTRLAIVPDRFIARLSRLKPRPLLTATDFERAEVRVELSGVEYPAVAR